MFDIISVLSLPLIISVMLYHYKHQQKKNKKNILSSDAKLTLRYISMAVIAISAIGIAFPVLSVFLGLHLEPFSGNSYANELFLLLSSFSTVYIFLLIFCLPVKVVFKEILRMLKIDIKEDIGQQTSSDNYEQSNSRLKKRTKIGLLLLAMFLSVILVLIPQHPSINKGNQDIGVDTHFYVTWIGELAKSRSGSDFVYQSFIVPGARWRQASIVDIYVSGLPGRRRKSY